MVEARDIRTKDRQSCLTAPLLQERAEEPAGRKGQPSRARDHRNRNGMSQTCRHRWRAGMLCSQTRRWVDRHRSQITNYRWTWQAWLAHSEACASESKQELEAVPQTQWTPVR